MDARARHVLVSAGLAALLVIVIAAARGLPDGSKAQVSPAPAAVPVTTAVATRRPVPVVARGIGTVTPLNAVLVRARIDGQLDRVLFREGQEVTAGDVLARIDPRALQAQLAQSEAQQGRDEAQLANALLDLKRYATLVQQDSIARQQLDTQGALVGQLRATVKLDQALVDNARVQLDYATIRAPVGGRTGKRLVDPGNIVHAADATGIVTINQIDPISVLFTLPEGRLQPVLRAQAAAPGRPLAVQASGRTDPAVLATGTLTLVNNQIDAGTGTFQLRAVFPNAAGALWPGQFVNVRLVLSEVADGLTIPDAAVQRGPDGLFTYVVRPDGSVAPQPIVVDQSEAGRSLVTRGLAGGEHVVVDGQYKLRPGVKVTEAAAG
ncbi:efflux RND transporter periplasmic adaptor subunit [Ramlibacter tataouinensis]|uniref:efflux RND transporter periplasmic adaptor subunit n=1 Tax=Ramlibacter tataouinensis TaxID=94132 RepID=UPI0022F39306|nr:efflux RND transporter periplasmic adaptor subunit [Ramlibacter tataouinensis]WBY02842.1 efflux RND transporter periplasmic adaptor subunit [Ramlibacter tataouinensis]